MKKMFFYKRALVASAVVLSLGSSAVCADPMPGVPASPEAAKPEAAVPDVMPMVPAKPEAGKPEAGKPEAAVPDVMPMVPAKPEAGKPEAGKPGAVKPEAEKDDKETANQKKQKENPDWIEILTDGTWVCQLDSLGLPADTAKPNQKITLKVLPPKEVKDGYRFAGCAGINRYFGGFKELNKDGKMTFGTAGSTMMMGPGEAYERAYLRMLTSVLSFKIDGGTLLLFGEKDKQVAKFKLDPNADE